MSVHFFKVAFRHSAQGANPSIGDVFKSGSGGDSVVGVANFRVIYPIADGANVFIHNKKIYLELVIVL